MRWLPLGVVVLTQVAYPLVTGGHRAAVAALTVVLGYAFSVGHATATRGARTALVLVLVTTLGGLAVEALGVATGFPFGSYEYGDALGPTVVGVPLVIPLAWTWMAWPAWLAAGYLTARPAARVALAGFGLATWDLFLDPQMVREEYWRWTDQDATALPGVAEIPLSNYLGWLAVAVVMMGLFAAVAGRRITVVDHRDDGPMVALYLWTYFASIVAHALFLDLSASALWGGTAMGLVALPVLATVLAKARQPRPRAVPHAVAETTPGPAVRV